MAEINQFGSAKPGTPDVCAHCEALLMDVLDRTASPSDQTFFDRHLASCTTCSRMFMDAKRGGAWLEMLRNPRPEPSSTLFERIIAQTSGAQTSTQSSAQSNGAQSVSDGSAQAPNQPVDFLPQPIPAPSPYLYGAPGARPTHYTGAKVLPFRLRNAVHSISQTMLQPRLAMTAAMAFFSIALTLNLTGVHLSELHAEDLKPANINKSFHQATGHVIRYCDNLRVVYELEARAHDLQRSSDNDTNSPAPEAAKPAQSAPAPQNKPNNPPDPKQDPADHKNAKPGPGTSRREPLFPNGRMVAALSVREPEDLFAVHSPVHRASQPEAHPKGDLA